MAVIGRRDELAGLLRAVDAARDGHASVLGLRGQAGSGKTSLLAEVERLAAGFTVLRVTGVETESDLAFAALVTLLRNSHDVLGRLAAPQRDALRSALAIGPPTMPDRLAVGAAVLQCVALLAERRPVLVVVDDLQWIDRASLDALLFACRRLGADQVVAAFAWRDDFEVDARGFEVHEIGPLGDPDARAVLLQSHSFDADVADEVARLCGGHPLALVQAAASLTDRQRKGIDALTLPLDAGRAGEELFRQALTALDSGEFECLLIAALSDSDDLTLIAEACGAAGFDRPDWGTAERERLIVLSANRLTFAHPLARGAVVQLADPPVRRRAHWAIAETLCDGAPRTIHRAAATIEPDENVAKELAALAQLTLGRGDSTTASRLAEQSARLTLDPSLAAERWLLAAHCGSVAGLDPTAQLEGAERLGGPTILAECTILRAAVAGWSGDVEALDLLNERIDELARTDRVSASVAQAFLDSGAWNRLDVAGASAIARRAWDLADHAADLPHRFGLMPLVGYVTFGSFSPGSDALTYLDTCANLVEQAGLSDLATPVVTAMLVAGRHLDALAFGERMHAFATRYGAVAATAWTATACGLAIHRIGDLDAARRWLEQGREFGALSAPLAFVVATAELAQVAARQGDVLGCRSLLAELSAAQGTTEHTVALAAFAHVLNASAAGDHAEVVRLAPALLRLGVAVNEFIPALYELIEALVALGRFDDGRELASLLDEIDASPVVNHRGQVARCRALLTESPRRIEHFEASLSLLRGTARRLELARTQLAYGEYLRREGSRSAAREHLREALDFFEAQRCAPLAERARRELRASGVVVSPARHDRGELTPQESQVAHALSTGRSTREVATMLFLSPRTVEMHLTRIYRKFGVENRRELAALHRRLGDQPPD